MTDTAMDAAGNTDVKKIVHEFKHDWESFKKLNKETIDQQIKGHVDPLLEQHLNRINEALSKSEDAIDAATKAQALIKANREMGVSQEDEAKRALKEAFLHYIRKGADIGLTQEKLNILNLHTKKLSSASDPAGGYAVLPDMDREITRILTETSPMRRVARVKTISSDQYEKLQRVDSAGAGWADRDNSPTETSTPTFRKLSIKAWKLQAMPQISQDLIDDAFIDIEAELTQAVAETFDVLENTAFVVGDGVGQPRGILDFPAGTAWGQIEQVPSGSNSGLTYEGLIDLVAALKDGYLSNAVFMMKRSAVAAVRKMTNTGGDPLWVPGLGAEPATLLGYPIVRAADMPAIAQNALSIAFGDFRRGYVIVDRLGTRVLRNPYTNPPYVSFWTYRRVGGHVDNYEAIKLQKITE